MLIFCFFRLFSGNLAVLDILYQDHILVAVNKPSGWDVHRGPYSGNRKIVMTTLRDQLGRLVHPVHRLDGGTSGVLLFALDKETQCILNARFADREIEKKYNAIVRGFAKDVLFDRPLKVAKSTSQVLDSRTDFSCLARIELPWPNERYPTSRYSLVEARPLTGRFHQIRRHLNHLGWPVVGDSVHGDSTHNHLWRNRAGINRLMLHASWLSLDHPSGGKLEIGAPLPCEFKQALNLEGWTGDLPTS
jgi:tRNA pseudouridine65 synthase